MTHWECLESSLNKNKEYLQNGCKLFHLKYNPSENSRHMDPVWTQFINSGQVKLVLGHWSKVYVLPAPGQQDPHQITLIFWYMNFHCRYTGVSHIHSHTMNLNLDKCVKITMVDGSVPHRKFTMLRLEYMDLRTSEGLDVFMWWFLELRRHLKARWLIAWSLPGTQWRVSFPPIWLCVRWHGGGTLVKLRGYYERMAWSLMDCFEMEITQLANQSTFNQATGTVTTQFTNADDFLDQIENELGSDDNGVHSTDRSVDGIPHGGNHMWHLQDC